MLTQSKLIIAGLMVSNLVFSGLYYFDNPATPKPLIVDHKPLMSETITPSNDAPLHALQQKVADLEQTLLKERNQHQAVIGQWQQVQTNPVPVKITSINNTFVDSYLNNQQLDKNGKPLLVGDALQKWREAIQSALVNSIASETSPEKLLLLTQQLKSLKTTDSLNDETSQKLLQNTAYLNVEQQGDMLASLEGKVSANALKDLEPLLYSNNEEIAEEAFLRLQEMGVNSFTKAYFEQLAVNSQSEWVRHQATKMSAKR